VASVPELVRLAANGTRVELTCPTSMPRADAFLWNPRLLLQVNCRGYASAQYLQPEPARYSHAPVLEQRTFMQPEQPYFAHHPGRFAYVKDEQTGALLSVPYAPVNRRPEQFLFSAGTADVLWQIRHMGIAVDMAVVVPTSDVCELWTLTVRNQSAATRAISLYPFFSIGYMSWMNQSALYDPELGAVVASSVTPYQKLSEYPRIRELSDRTFLLHELPPDAWETSQSAFEGNGGLHAPDALLRDTLGFGKAEYETPVAVLQYRLKLAPGESRRFRFVFGPAQDARDIRRLRERYFAPAAFDDSRRRSVEHLVQNRCLEISTPDAHFDAFANHFLGRQVLYHGDTSRMTADPQTRNFLQDNMGMIYVDPPRAKRALLTALAQQKADGNMPEGIVLAAGTELKYINQVPHTDHCVWLPVFLDAWLGETGDRTLLDETVPETGRSVFDAVTAAMRWLVGNRDTRGLSLIAEGDWCDPMNMVGPLGRGVSGWLTMASVHAMRLWIAVCREHHRDDVAAELLAAADGSATAARKWLWDGDWFARGITDAGQSFGVAGDTEGRLFLNPQTWAILARIANEDECRRMIGAIDAELDTPFGTALLAPAYTAMREDIGRVTQKFPGTAENGSVYNHAVAFYVAALYQLGEADRAWTQLRRMLPGPEPDDYLKRGQLPVYMPNYYRGAWQQYPDAAGRSSHLCHTGAASWLYRIVTEELFGLKGCREGLCVRPQLPSHWTRAAASRRFRGATFDVLYTIGDATAGTALRCDGRDLPDGVVQEIVAGQRYALEVVLPRAGSTRASPKAASLTAGGAGWQSR
jgi:cellobionic acid phosphorylase